MVMGVSLVGMGISLMSIGISLMVIGVSLVSIGVSLMVIGVSLMSIGAVPLSIEKSVVSSNWFHGLSSRFVVSLWFSKNRFRVWSHELSVHDS